MTTAQVQDELSPFLMGEWGCSDARKYETRMQKTCFVTRCKPGEKDSCLTYPLQAAISTRLSSDFEISLSTVRATARRQLPAEQFLWEPALWRLSKEKGPLKRLQRFGIKTSFSHCCLRRAHLTTGISDCATSQHNEKNNKYLTVNNNRAVMSFEPWMAR